MKPLHYVLGGIVLVLIIIGGGYVYLHSKTINVPDGLTGTTTQANSSSSDGITFNGITYIKGDTLAEPPDADYTSKSYEWVTGGETVNTWTSLITTHDISPLDPSKPLVAADYAQNVAAMLKSNGAELLETSLVNTPDAVAAGVDAQNPPYLLVYIFPAGADAPSEFDIQRIENGPDGSINSFIYAKKLSITKDSDVETFMASPEYLSARKAVVLAHVPR